MSPLVRRYIKTALVFLAAGLALGLYLVVAEFVLRRFPPHLVITAHVHLLLVGFLVMLVMGVATWMFPRLPAADRRGEGRLAEAAYWTITAATVLRAAAELGAAAGGPMWLRPLVALGGVGQAAAVFLFIVAIWPRVRGPAGGK